LKTSSHEKFLNTFSLNKGLSTSFYIAIEIRHTPRRAALIRLKPRDEMQVKMTRALPKGNQVNPVAAAHLLNKLGSLLNNSSPFAGFITQKVDCTSEMATSIEQTPTKQGRRMRMVTQ
jgi:hypothetical protein